MTSRHVGPATGIEPACRLVQEEDRRVGNQGTREVQAPSHAARVGLGHAVTGILEPKLGQQLARAVTARLAAEVIEPADHVQVLETGEVLVDRRHTARTGRCVAEPPEGP